jgi:histidinol dehydrogenase
VTPLRPQRLDSRDADFRARLDALLDRAPEISPEITAVVDEIIDAVRRDGDAALIAYTNRFDRRQLRSADELILPAAALASAWHGLPADLRAAL